MSKLRKNTVNALHRLVADAALDWQDPNLSEPLRRYILEHGAHHLYAIDDREGLWQLLRNEQYQRAQIESREQYEATYQAFRYGIFAYATLEAATPEDNGRLCWLALRASELGEEARQDVTAAFEWMRERPMEDERRVDDALARISVLDEEGFYKSALLLLWIEADRLELQPEHQRTNRGAQRVLDAVEDRIPSGNNKFDWNKFLSVNFMAWLLTRIIDVCPHLDLAPIVARTSQAKPYVLRLLKLGLNPDRIDELLLQHVLQVIDHITQDYNRAEALTTVASMLAKAYHQTRAEEIFVQALHMAEAMTNDRWRARTLTTLGDVLAQTGNIEQAQSVCGKALLASNAIAEERWKAEALATIAPALARCGQFDQALQVLLTIKEDYRKASGIGAVASVAADTGEPLLAKRVCARLLRMAESFQNDRWKAESFAAVAPACAKSGDTPQAQRLCRQALALTEAFTNDYWASQIIVAVVAAIAQIDPPSLAYPLYQQARQLAHTIADELLQASTLAAIATELANTRYFEPAVEVARSITEYRWKAKTVAAIASALTEAGDKQRAGKIFNEATHVASSITYDRWRAETVATVATVLAHTGRFEQAIQAADVIMPQRWKIEAFTAIVSALTQAGDASRARQLFVRVISTGQGTNSATWADNNEAFGAVAIAFTQARQFTQALQVAEAMTSDHWKSKTQKSHTLAAIAVTLAETDESARAHNAFEHAFQIADTIKEVYRKAGALAALGIAITKAGDSARADQVFAQAIRLAETITDDHFRADCLEDVAKAIAQTGKFETALGVAHSIKDDHRRAETLAAVSSALAAAGRVQQTLRVANTIKDPRFKARSLAAAASALARAGDTKAAQQLCEQAQQIVSTVSYKADAIAAIAKAFALSGQFQQAIEVAATIKNDWHIAGTLVGITSAVLQSNDSSGIRQMLVEQVLAIADRVTNQRWKVEALVNVGRVFAQTGDQTRAGHFVDQACQVADTIVNDQDKAKALLSIGSVLVEFENADHFEQLLEQLSVSQQVWNDLLPPWRDTLRTSASSPCRLLRKSLCHNPFSNRAAINGSLSLLQARIEEQNDEAWRQIIHQCPQLKLGFLLDTVNEEN